MYFKFSLIFALFALSGKFWCLALTQQYPAAENPDKCVGSPGCVDQPQRIKLANAAFDARQHPNYKLLPSINDCGKQAKQNKSDDEDVLKRRKRTNNGKPADIGKYLMAVRILARNTSRCANDVEYLYCTGSLINNLYVLTSAGCAGAHYGESNIVLSKIELGREDISFSCSTFTTSCPYEVRGIDEIIVHEDYVWTSHENNIALIRMDKEVVFTEKIKPVCLPYNENLVGDLEDQEINVPGWGLLNLKEDDQVQADRLYEVSMALVPRTYCDIFVSRLFGKMDKSRLCGIGKQNQMDLCRGDGGAPGIRTISLPGGNTTNDNDKIQFQIALHGTAATLLGTCGDQGVPRVFTNVMAYMPWILDHLKP